MKRRTLISSIVTTGTLTIAGCSSLIGDDEGPDDITEAFFEALTADNFNTARDLVHEDTPDEAAKRLLDGEESLMQQLEETEFTVERTEVLESDDDEAVVEIDVTQRTDAETDTVRARFALRNIDGDWILWDQLETTQIE